MKECLQLPPPPLCDRAICVATRQGYGLPNDTLNLTGANIFIEKEFEGEQNFLSVIKDKCINGNIFHYGPPDECFLTKFEICMRVHLLSSATTGTTMDNATA